MNAKPQNRLFRALEIIRQTIFKYFQSVSTYHHTPPKKSTKEKCLRIKWTRSKIATTTKSNLFKLAFGMTIRQYHKCLPPKCRECWVSTSLGRLARCKRKYVLRTLLHLWNNLYSEWELYLFVVVVCL